MNNAAENNRMRFHFRFIAASTFRCCCCCWCRCCASADAIASFLLITLVFRHWFLIIDFMPFCCAMRFTRCCHYLFDAAHALCAYITCFMRGAIWYNSASDYAATPPPLITLILLAEYHEHAMIRWCHYDMLYYYAFIFFTLMLFSWYYALSLIALFLRAFAWLFCAATIFAWWCFSLIDAFPPFHYDIILCLFTPLFTRHDVVVDDADAWCCCAITRHTRLPFISWLLAIFDYFADRYFIATWLINNK